MNRQEKAEEVSKIQDLLSGAQLVVLTEYSGLDVAAMVSLRQELRKVGSRYRIVKNTLAKIATDDSELKALAEYFKGPVAVAVTEEDAAATAKALVTFQKSNKELEIKAGFLSGGKVLDADAIEALSKLPGKDQLRAMLLGTLNGVPRKLVTLFSQVPRGFVNVLDARRRQLEEQ